MKHTPLVAGASLAFALLLTAGRATGQAVDPARDELIAHAVQARGAGDHTGALDFAQRAEQIRTSPSLRRFIAEEQQALGQLSRALVSAELCVEESRVSTRPTDAPHGRVCQDLVAQLSPRVGRLIVRVPAGATADLVITVGGEPLPRALWGVPRAVTPGTITLVVAAPGRPPEQHDLRVPAGATVPWDVVVTTSSAPSVGPLHDEPTTPGGGVPAARAHAGAGAAPWVVVVAGAVVVVAAPLLWLAGEGELGAARMACGNVAAIAACADATPSQYEAGMMHYGSAQALFIARDVALGVGLAAVAGGLLWFALGGHPARTRVGFNASPDAHGGARAGLSITF